MEFVLCSQEYVAFRSKLANSSSSARDLLVQLGSALFDLAPKLHIGFVGCGLMAPATPLCPNGENGSLTIYHDREALPIIPSKSDVVHVTPTGEKGFFTLMVHPIKGHTFTEEEKLAIQLLNQDCYMLGGRARLIGMVQKAAITDPMTGVDNQTGLMQFASQIMAQGNIHDYTGIFINLKNFKYINKSANPQVGDLALKMYVNSAKNFLNNDEIIARLGGDNFYVMIRKENAQAFIDKYTSLPISVSQNPKPISFNIMARMGVYPIRQGDTPTEFMNNASIALNVARSVRNIDVMSFSNDMLVNALHQREISSEFHSAIRNKEFLVYYQPKVDLNTKQICGSEALVRWLRHKTIVPPMDFIPILECEGSICALDFYVFERVCQDIHLWLESGIEPVRISVNFSKIHLKNTHLADDILSIMQKYNVDSKYIEVELTEVSDYEDSIAMQNFVSTMRKKGVSISIDDFGTGYSTLNVLKNLDVDVIKLDKSLLDNIDGSNSQGEVVVRNVVNLAKEMHKEVIAEGVENEQQAKFLSTVNCTKVQGYLFDKPLKREDFQNRLTQKVYC